MAGFNEAANYEASGVDCPMRRPWNMTRVRKAWVRFA